MAAAPAESTCSHSGIFTCGPARLMTAMTSGARASRWRSASACSGLASGYLIRNARTMASPAARRASPSKMMNRQGVSLPWSGTREATVSRVSISAAVGGGPASSIGLIERRVLSSSRASVMPFIVVGDRQSVEFFPPTDHHRFLAYGLFSPRLRSKNAAMRLGGTRTGRGGQLVLVQFALAAWIAAIPAPGHAQFFTGTPVRPPNDVPSVPPGPAQPLTPPPSGHPAPASPKGPMLQSPPAGGPAAAPQAAPNVPAGQGALAVSARFGRDLPAINGGLHWRIYRAEQNGVPRVIKEDRGAAPTFVLPPGSYVINVGFGLANVTRAVQLRAETVKEVFEIPAGGLRIEGRVGGAKIPPKKINFELTIGRHFEP